MKLVTFDAGEGPRAGCLRDDGVVDLAEALDIDGPLSLIDFLSRGGRTPASWPAGRPLDQVRLCAPVERPGKIIGVGRNYGAHAAEGGLAAQESPRLFTKVPSSVIGPDAVIRKPAAVTRMDWEVEIAVVVGRPMRDVATADALDCVGGYTIINDVSAREFQFEFSPPQTSFAKSLDGFSPMGPWLVTPDEVGDPADLGLRCWVNDRLMQDGHASDMIFPIPELLAYICRYMTLQPGDVVATGTPAGVGVFRDPPVYLQPGDRIRMEVDRLGVLENTVA